jgi:hypothetical protein
MALSHRVPTLRKRKYSSYTINRRNFYYMSAPHFSSDYCGRYRVLYPD